LKSWLSLLGDRWYDNNKKESQDFKFEVNSAVDSIEFPMNQNLNLQLQNEDVVKIEQQEIQPKSDMKSTLNV
jgi:uncharacterized protein YaaW (UPF0174 family)